jgi:colanic acid biosynthesis glycosyl transferase WcaI
MRIQLWSYNYDPEPLGIGPVSRVWALGMQARGHEVEVIAAHPHYPEPRWGWRARPYREMREGIPVIRLPLLPGRSSGARRMLQELSFAASQSLASPFLSTPDVLVAVSPSFPAVLPMMVNARIRETPWTLWLKDILPDGAAATGYLRDDGRVFRVARRLEMAAYRSASKIVVLSETFRENLLSKGVPPTKVVRAYDPATRPIASDTSRRQSPDSHPPRILCMGNIGKSQNLRSIVRAFESDPDLARMGARLILTGTGVAEDEVRTAIRTDRVEMKGLVSDEELQRELDLASLGAVTQHYGGAEFNVPSKLMNYFGSGLPVIASVDPAGEVTRLLELCGGGWATSSADPASFARQAAAAFLDPSELGRRGAAAWKFARDNFAPEALVAAFERELEDLLERESIRAPRGPVGTAEACDP